MTDKETKQSEPTKDEVAKAVESNKQRYYFPSHNRSVEATSTAEATELVEKELADEKKKEKKS